MKTSPSKTRGNRGYVSVLMVVTTGAILSMLTIYAYRRASAAQMAQGQVQLRLDYSEKEEAILRAIVAITPNRAIRAMQSGSNADEATRNPLRWQDIFTESLVLANARTSISPGIITKLNVPNLRLGNTGDSALGNPAEIFRAIAPETGYVSVGNNRNLGTGFPVPLNSSDITISGRDALYPIISSTKSYGALAQTRVGLAPATYPNFNLLKYPDINFGYAKPGEDFVAKRNWWSFSVDVADNDDNTTRLARNKRNFVLSLYEIPSQLPISASSFMSLGQYASGEAWQNVTIDGGIFAGKAETTGSTAISALSSRRGMTLSTNTVVGGKNFSGSNPFTPGVRENYQTTQGAFFPVSLASESGRAAFIPINRGAEFFDRFAHAAETSVLSDTTWNDYTIGALQCAMRLDVVAVKSSTDPTPTLLQFDYFLPNGTRPAQPYRIPVGSGVHTVLYEKYVKISNEDQSYNFTTPVDVAYGAPGGFIYRPGVSGTIAFNNATFGDPLVGTVKAGYYRTMAAAPVETKFMPGGQTCIAVYPERIPQLLRDLGAATAGPAQVVGPFGLSPTSARLMGQTIYNNSLAVNVDYTVKGLNNATKYKPSIPCTVNDYGVILRECSDLTAFTRGFSLVTNLRTFVGDDFNVKAATPPADYVPRPTTANPTGRYLPPCSLFTPELRYGVDANPFSVMVGGQVGSLSKVDKVNASDAEVAVVRPLDSKDLSGVAIASNRITVNLSQIRHPAELPPISMMNWLILLEERRKEFN